MDCHRQLRIDHELKFLADDTGVIVAAPTRRVLMETRVNCQNLGSYHRTNQKLAQYACLTVKSCFV